MSSVLSIRDGETYCHSELQTMFGFKTERACKEWITKRKIPVDPVLGKWWMAGEDIRKAMRLAAQTTDDRRDSGEAE